MNGTNDAELGHVAVGAADDAGADALLFGEELELVVVDGDGQADAGEGEDVARFETDAADERDEEQGREWVHGDALEPAELAGDETHVLGVIEGGEGGRHDGEHAFGCGRRRNRGRGSPRGFEDEHGGEDGEDDADGEGPENWETYCSDSMALVAGPAHEGVAMP
jgi:hypothetical protein